MKAKFFALAALVLGLASCQNDFNGVRGNASGEVDFQLKVDAAELGATRADQDGRNGHDSAFGAIDYLTEADWNNVDLRYSLEVYEVKNNTVTEVPVKDRMVQIVDKYTPVTFDLRLIPTREYRFVVFADFVPEGSTAEVEGKTLTDHNSDLGLYHEIGANLRDIKVVNDALFTECADAYFAFEDITINNGEPHSLILKRPYGKLRVVATDLAEINTNVNPAKVVVRYDAIHPAAFNAVTGEIEEEKAGNAEYVYTYKGVGTESLANHYYTKGYDAETVVTAENKTRHTHMTLFTDYILAEDDQRGVHFTLEVLDNNGELIKSTDFDTEIPVQRNHLTTIIGNVMTTATEINVTIDDNFANMDREYYVFEAFTNVEGFEQGINDGVVTLDRDYVIGQTIYVRKGINATLNLNGFSIKNAKENEYTDVIIVEEGASLTINGQGLIEAVSGNNGYAVIAEGKVTINGGTFKAGKDENGEANALVYARGNGEVYVNGGEFLNEHHSEFVLNKKDADRATTVIEVRGGKFWHFDPSQNAAENKGTDFVPVGWGAYPYVFDYGVSAWEVKPVSEANYIINGEHFDYENEVILRSVFHNGGKVKFAIGEDSNTTIIGRCNIEIVEALVAGKCDVTLSGEGKIFVAEDRTIYKDGVVSAVICAKNGVTVNFDNYYGEVNGGAEDYAIEVRGGNMVVNGGHFLGAVTAAYAFDGNIEINGGQFEANASEYGATYLLNLKDRNAASIVAKGGEFLNFDPMNNAAENPAVNFCAEGYVTYEENDWYKVVSGAVVTNADEFKAAASNANLDYIIVAADLDFGTSTATVTTDKIIKGNGHKLTAGGTTASKNYGLGFSGVNAKVYDLVMNGGGGIYATNGANLEINNVTLKTQYSASGRHMFYVSNATLTVNSGTFEVGRTGCKYFSMENNARAYVKGGTFEDMMAKDTPVYLATGAELEITGGKFQVGTANYKFDPTAWVPATHKAERVGNYMEVSAL